MMFRQDRWTFGISVVVLALASVCVAQAASAQTTGSIVQWGGAIYDLPTPNSNFTAVAAGGLYGLGLRHNGSIDAWGDNWAGRCDVPKPNKDFVAVAASGNHSLGLKNDGSIVAWGSNDHGQCDVPEPNSDFVAISAGYNRSLGLKTGGSITAWGQFYCDVPEPNNDFIAISAGHWVNLGLKGDGSIVAWGGNEGVPGMLDVPEPNNGFVAISAGYAHSLALKSDGSIVAWGWNEYGQCDVPEPNSGFVAIAAGRGHSLGLQADGSVVGWGRNQSGQCDAPEPNTGFFAISACSGQSLGLRVDSGEEPPVAQDDTYTTPADTTLVVEAPGILSNDGDPNGDPIIAIWDSGPSHGTLDYLNADGSFAYTPETGFTGTDAFTYTAFDGGYDSNVATVTITVGDLVEPGGISGTVFDASGKRVKAATVTAWMEGVPVESTSTAANGTYALSGLEPGDYEVVAVKDEPEGSAWATVYSGQTTTDVDIFIE